MSDVVGEVRDAEHRPAESGDAAYGGGAGDDPGDADRGKSQVEAADVADQVLVVGTAHADPVQPQTGERGVEGAREELSPDPHVQPDGCGEGEDHPAR